MTLFKPLLISVVTAALLSLNSGCATLPDIGKIHRETDHSKAPKILTSRGMLSAKKSRELMARLQEGGNRTDLLQRHAAVVETVSGSPLVHGNKVTLLVDGGSTYQAIFRVIENARDNINVETYKIDDDELGQSFMDLLLKKQSQGVQVNFMYDSIGSLTTSDGFFDRLRKAGGQVVQVNPLNPLQTRADPPSYADHRKMLIVDGRVVITGGINISRVYASTPFQRKKAVKQGEKPPVPWRDTDIMIEGPVVAEFQKLFLDLWNRHKGRPLSEPAYFPKLKEQGSALVRAIGSSPGEKNRVNYVSYVSAITFAEHSIHLTSAYFIPDDRTLHALMAAARRGVEVKILVPSISDSNVALHAMRYNYAELLKAGVRLYERKKVLLHAKTAVIDSVWSTVGSTNLDMLSLSKNYEVNAVVLSREFAAQMERMFQDDLAESEELRLEKWKERPATQKMKEFFSHMFSHLI